MVPVLQLYAKDVPDVPFPAGADLLQVLWCPVAHEFEDMFERPMPRMAPACQAFWRSSNATGAVSPPELDLSSVDDDYLPEPCTVHPEHVEDYPNLWELDEKDRAAVESHEFDYEDVLGPAPGSKVGGWVAWDQEPEAPTCDVGHDMTHLATIATVESWSDSWTADDDVSRQTAGLMIGDCGGYFLFTCTQCPDRPVAAVTQ
jgi:hypothetical protein